jgi:hypothetical protein
VDWDVMVDVIQFYRLQQEYGMTLLGRNVRSSVFGLYSGPSLTVTKRHETKTTCNCQLF